MDIILALQFVSKQYLNGIIDGESYHGRVLELLEEAASQTNTNELMYALAEHMVRS